MMADIEWVGGHKGPLYEMLKDLRDHLSDDAVIFVESGAGDGGVIYETD